MQSQQKKLAAIAWIFFFVSYSKSNMVQPWMSIRKADGVFHTIFQELKKEDAEGFRD